MHYKYSPGSSPESKTIRKDCSVCDLSRNRSLGALLILLFAFLISGTSVLALDVSGELEGGVWTISDSPVVVQSDILLGGQDTLDIEPGVRVEFNGPFKFTVNGLLRAVGEKENRIVFTAADPDIDSLKWKGIRFVNAARGCELKFCKVMHGWARGAWPENNGGGLYIESSSLNIERTEIIFNKADADGGGIYSWFTQSVLRNTLIAFNEAEGDGGGLFTAYSTPRVSNCTVAMNHAVRWGGGLFAGSEGNPVVGNSIVTFNTKDSDIGDEHFSNFGKTRSAEPTVSFSCISETEGTDPYPGPGNFVDDPNFIDRTPENYDFHLKYDSPCIDSGDPQANPGDETDNYLNLGAYGGVDESTPSVPVFFNNLIPNDTTDVPLRFDSRRINSQTTREITIDNHGHARLVIEDLEFSSPVLFPDSVERDGLIVAVFRDVPIEPGERLKFGINFVPDELTEYAETITFITNDTIATPEPPRIRVTGEGIDPIISIQDTVEFGRRQIDGEYEIRVPFSNTGRSALTVSSTITVQGDGFSVEIPDRSLEPNEQEFVIVTFEPEAPSGYQGVIGVRTNDRNVNLTALGIGVGPKMVVETDSLFLGYVFFDGDTSKGYTIPIENRGDQVLTMRTPGVGNQAAFSTPAIEGLEIQPGESYDLPVFFHPPQANQDFQAVLTLSGPPYPLAHSIDLYGRGMAEPGEYVFGEVTGAWEVDPADPVDFIVLDSVYVPPHEALKIRQGVRVLFEPGAAFYADGEVRAVGTPSDSIYFIPRDQSGADSVRWKILELNLDDNTRLSYCKIAGSREGVMITESSPLIEFCSIVDNGIAGTEDNDGGGIYMENAGTRLNGCIIGYNRARFGGGLFILNSKPVITNCIIHDNTSANGGGIYLKFQAAALIQSNLIYKNTADTCGGISINVMSSPMIVNNTIANNTGGGVLSGTRSIPSITNSIVWDNAGESIKTNPESNVLVSYSNIELEDADDAFTGRNNYNVDPNFENPAADNYRLAMDSELIDAGNPEPAYRDYFFPPSQGAAVNDVGAYGGPLGGGWETPEVAITVFQNPAFPNWIDIYVVSMTMPQTVPTCSLSVEYGRPISISLSQLQEGVGSYHGSYELTESGVLFLTVDAMFAGDRSQKAGRTYNIAFVEPGEAASVGLNGIAGSILIGEDAVENQKTVITGIDYNPVKPDGDLLFLSPAFDVFGLGSDLKTEAEIKINFDEEGWTQSDMALLGVFKIEKYGCRRMDGGYESGEVTGKIREDGKYILGWGVIGNSGDSRSAAPNIAGLIKAYPNPFNQKVSIEFKLLKKGPTSLGIYDLAGRRIVSLVNGEINSGKHVAVWDGRGVSGQALPSGIYWARLDAVGQSNSIKLLLLR